jgi:hypothetical protein
MSAWRSAIVLCNFRHNSPAGPVINSDNEHDDRNQHDIDDLPELENIIQPDWLPVQPPPPPGPPTPLPQPMTPLPGPPPPPPPPPPPQPTKSISIDKVFANFRSVLNLQLIAEDEQNTDADAARQQAAAAVARLARADFVDSVRPVTPTPEELISLLHHYPEAAATACAERMGRPHNLQSSIVGRQAHPYIGQFISPQRPGDPRCGRCTSGQHVRLETTSPLPSPDPPTSPRSTPKPPAVPPPALAVPPPALAPIAGHQHQIRMLPVELPPRPTAAATGRARVRQQQQQPERHLTQTCVCLDYKIPARIAVISRGQTVLRSVRRRCTRQISLAARISAPALPFHTQSTHFTFPVFSPTRAVFSPTRADFSPEQQ